jgi:hypothetical protein
MVSDQRKRPLIFRTLKIASPLFQSSRDHCKHLYIRDGIDKFRSRELTRVIGGRTPVLQQYCPHSRGCVTSITDKFERLIEIRKH